MKSATLNRRSENVFFEAVVIAELKFGYVQRHILLADLMEGADDATLEDASEAFNRLVVDGGAVREFCAQMLVADPLVGAEQADFPKRLR